MDESAETEAPPVRELSKSERRVLGVLVEKAFTTPENYPLTLKALTAGANQKSNRQPITNYSEDDVADVTDALRQLHLAAVVHTQSGRTERYRHYARHRFTLTEPQLAILTELLLRGRQQLGELRARASRMVSIDDLDQLREELRGMQEMGLVQTSGSLERRGAEVDHNLYHAAENRTLVAGSDRPPPVRDRESAVPAAQSASAPPPATVATSQSDRQLIALKEEIEALRGEMNDIRAALRNVQNELQRLTQL